MTVAKTPQSIAKEALTITTKAEVSVSSDAGNTPTSDLPLPEDPLASESADTPAESTSSSEEFPSPQSIVIDSRNFMVDGYEMLAQKRTQDQGMIKAAEVRAVEEQTRIDTQHSKVETQQQAPQQIPVHDQPGKVVVNAGSDADNKQLSNSVEPRHPVQKSLFILLAGLVIGSLVSAVGSGYYYKFGFSFPFFNDVVDKSQDGTSQKASLLANPITEARAEESGNGPIADEEAELGGVGEAAEITVAEMSPSPSDIQVGTAQEMHLIFHLVAGSFEREQNAHKLHIELMGQGYQAVFLGKIGDYYKVSYQSFSNEANASTALQELNEKGVNSWMMRHELR